MKKYPKVSVVTITYGHENYIIETIKGVLMQEYQGDIEFIIANDNSPDETDKVVKEFFLQNTIPSNFEIKYTNHPINKGMMPNFIWALEQTSGNYIALCEGDDYWTDPLKLQKQVDFLEENEDYILVCTNAENTPIINLENKEIKPFQLLHSNPVRTLTTLFRNHNLKKIEQKNMMMGDFQLWMHLIKIGKFAFLKDNTAFYRILENSASGRNCVNKQILFLLDRISITYKNIDSFSFSRKQKKQIVQDQYSFLIMKSLKRSKIESFKFYLDSIYKSGSVNLLDLKMLKNFL